jgi:hypothetical protein
VLFVQLVPCFLAYVEVHLSIQFTTSTTTTTTTTAAAAAAAAAAALTRLHTLLRATEQNYSIFFEGRSICLVLNTVLSYGIRNEEVDAFCFSGNDSCHCGPREVDLVL